MDYVVFDLEWNQGNTGKEGEAKGIPFEIIEIGAVKLNADFEMTGQFNRLVKPQIYHELNYVTRDLIHLNMEELENGQYFPEVVKEFLEWCGEEYMFCTWGPMDLPELQKNMKFYGMEPLENGPMKYYDVQKLFSIGFEDRKSRRTLEYAIDFLELEKDIPFHRAFSDAYYTAKVMAELDASVFGNYSFDVFVTPKSRKEEIKVIFDNYAKYISREFESKSDALADREAMSIRCYLCRRNIKRKMKWTTPNGKHYYGVGYCAEHGYVKAKVRVRKSENDKVYIVKTTKFISEEDAELIMEKRMKQKHV